MPSYLIAGILAAVVVTWFVVRYGRSLQSTVRKILNVSNWCIWQLPAVLRKVMYGIAGILVFIVSLIVMGPLALVPWGFFLVVLLSINQRLLAQQSAYLWMLTLAAERSMPLGPAIATFSATSWGRLARRWRKIARLLDEGVPPTEAIGRVRGAVPPDVFAAMYVGFETGAPAVAMRRALSTRNQNSPLWQSLVSKLYYVMIVSVLALVIIAFLMIKILPALKNIFQDFEMALPKSTQFLIAASNFFCAYWYLIVPFPLMILLIASPYAAARYTGMLHFDFPGTGRFTRRLDTAAILDALALAAERGRSLPDALATLVRVYPKRAIRRRLKVARGQIEAGTPWIDSLVGQNLLGQADAAVLRSAARVGNLPWAMREMADSSRRRFFYRANTALQVAFPLFVILFAGVVLLTSLAIFVPLITLIQALK